MMFHRVAWDVTMCHGVKDLGDVSRGRLGYKSISLYMLGSCGTRDQCCLLQG